MNQLFESLPRSLIVFLLLAGGIGIILLSDPPVSLCNAQESKFTQDQAVFLFKDSKSKFAKTKEYQILLNHCKDTNSPGGCFEYFNKVRNMVDDLRKVSTECRPDVANISEVHQVVSQTLELMVTLAWGIEPPLTAYEKYSWLGKADMALFCSLQFFYIQGKGDSQWQQKREALMLSLPGATGMPREELWQKSILSENCAQY